VGSERGIEDHLSGDADLMGGDAPLEKLVTSCTSWRSMKASGFRAPVVLRETERGEPLIGAEFEILSHRGHGEAGHAAPQEVLRELRLARHGLLEHDAHGLGHLRVEEFRLLVPDGLHDLEGEGHVGALVAEHPARTLARPCRRPREPKK
jgi:hypothetical protein